MKTRPCTTVRDSEDILEQSSFQQTRMLGRCDSNLGKTPEKWKIEKNKKIIITF